MGQIYMFWKRTLSADPRVWVGAIHKAVQTVAPHFPTGVANYIQMSERRNMEYCNLSSYLLGRKQSLFTRMVNRTHTSLVATE